MTDDDINAGFEAMAAQAAGYVAALRCAIHAIAAQPGFNRRAFVAALAVQQVAGEGRRAHPGFRKAFDELVSALAAPNSR
jgi:hypothetical protein